MKNRAGAATLPTRRPKSGARRLGTVGKTVAVVALLAFTLFPVYFMVSTAFNGGPSTGATTLVPTHLSLDNFSDALIRGNFATYLTNSLFVTVVVVIVSGFLALLGAVAVARFRFRMRASLLVLILIVQMLPQEALVIPLFLEMKGLGLLNSLVGLGAVYIAFCLPFAIWNLRGFVGAVPVEVEEAAYLDGCSWWRMFSRILLPLAIPGLIATSAFSFITAWEEFTFALTFLSDESQMTVGVGLKQFFGQHSNDWGGLMAASTLVTLPVVIFFVLAQRKLAAGLVAGTGK